jgi:hypothetical protein
MKSTPGPWKWYKADPPVGREDGAPTDDLWNALEHDPLTPGVPTVLTWCYSRDNLEDVQVRCSVADAALIAEAPALLAACHLLDSTNRGGTIPWVHNAAHTTDIEALRAICLAYAKVWNDHVVPAIEKAEGRP